MSRGSLGLYVLSNGSLGLCPRVMVCWDYVPGSWFVGITSDESWFAGIMSPSHGLLGLCPRVMLSRDYVR